jgi:hypothetical protein
MSIKRRLDKLETQIVSRDPPTRVRVLTDEQIAGALADAARRVRQGQLRFDAREDLGPSRIVDMSDDEVRTELNMARVAQVAAIREGETT